MNDLDEHLNKLGPYDTVMVAAATEEWRTQLLHRLEQTGANVLGPADRASLALALVGQRPADLALIEPQLAGRRDGFELAEALEEIWGVRSLVLGER